MFSGMKNNKCGCVWIKRGKRIIISLNYTSRGMSSGCQNLRLKTELSGYNLFKDGKIDWNFP